MSVDFANVSIQEVKIIGTHVPAKKALLAFVSDCEVK
jgi:hypothetical protein